MKIEIKKYRTPGWLYRILKDSNNRHKKIELDFLDVKDSPGIITFFYRSIGKFLMDEKFTENQYKNKFIILNIIEDVNDEYLCMLNTTFAKIKIRKRGFNPNKFLTNCY
jgi:hypothetical protein